MLLRVLTAVLVLGCVAPVPSAAQDTPRTGGVLKVAIVGEPPSLDIPLTTATLTYYEDVGTVKLGDYFTLDVARRELRGDFRTAPRMYFWNTWLAK